MSREAFWKHKELLKGNISLTIKKDSTLLHLSRTKIFMRKLDFK